MSNNSLPGGVVHDIPDDLYKAIRADKKVQEAWHSLTPLARNEWICWTISVKKEETRKEHITRLSKELKEGMRRPCCWYGCIHRKDKAVSPSVKGILQKKTR